MATTLARLTTPRAALRAAVAALYTAVIAAGLAPWPFDVHLLMHVAGATMLIGNALFMAVWLLLADLVGSDDDKGRAARAVNAGDVWFTMPAVVLLLAHGVAMATGRFGGLTAFVSTGWITAGLVLLTLTGVVRVLRWSQFNRSCGDCHSFGARWTERPSGRRFAGGMSGARLRRSFHSPPRS